MNRYKISSFFRTLLLFDSKGFFLYISKIGFSPYLLYLTTRTKTNLTFIKVRIPKQSVSSFHIIPYQAFIFFNTLQNNFRNVFYFFLHVYCEIGNSVLAFLFPRGHERTNIDSYNYKSKQADVKDFISIYRSFCFGE